MEMSIPITTRIKIKEVKDIEKYARFMEDNGLKINKSEIALRLNISRKTVAKYAKGFEKKTTREKKSKVSKYYEIIKTLLESNIQIFCYVRILYQYLVDNYGMDDIQIRTFYNYINSVDEFRSYFKNGKTITGKNCPEIRFETLPGEQAQFDWKESIPFVLKDENREIEINILTVLMSYSRFRIYKLSLNKTRESLLNALTEAFENIGGIPNTMLTDNMKTVMDDARTRYKKGEISPEFEAYAKDFGFKLCPCIAGVPKTKGKVESQMKILDEIKAYSGQLTLKELYELVARINERVNNQINFGTGKIPILDFEKEKDSLRPLPNESVRNQYKIETKTVKVNSASMISIKNNQYSVPSSLIGRKVTYQIVNSYVHIYDNTKLVALHPYSNKKLNYEFEHYENIMANKYVSKSKDEIKEMALNNLKIIGERIEKCQQEEHITKY